MKYLYIVPIAFLLCVMDAAIGSVLWNWFVATNFHLPRLSTFQVMGVGCAFAALFPRAINPINSKWTDEDQIQRVLEYVFIGPLLSLLIGALLHYCGV